MLRDDAHMATRRPRTSEYGSAARERLGLAVTRAREAAGYRSRPSFADATKIGLRTLLKLEKGEPVGPATYEAVGRFLPGWDEDTPRAILEGGTLPPAAKAAPKSAQVSDLPRGRAAADRLLAMSFDELVEESKLYGDLAETWLRKVIAIREEAKRDRARTPEKTPHDGGEIES